MQKCENAKVQLQEQPSNFCGEQEVVLPPKTSQSGEETPNASPCLLNLGHSIHFKRLVSILHISPVHNGPTWGVGDQQVSALATPIGSLKQFNLAVK